MAKFEIEPSTDAAESLRPRMWAELQAACLGKGHAWRTPVLATVDPDGAPQARTVVLRQVCAQTQTLVFYTDARSPKVRALRAQPLGSLVFWSADLGWQLRAQVRVQVEDTGPDVAAAWASVKDSAAAQDYLTGLAPGQPLDDVSRLAQHGLHKGHGPHHLALIRATVLSMDCLSLDRSGHLRARLSQGESVWLTP